MVDEQGPADPDAVDLDAARQLASGPDPRARTSPKAKQAFWVALAGVFFCGAILSIVAVVLALRAQAEIDDSHGRLRGTRLVVASYVLAVLGFVVFWVGFGLLAKGG